MLNLIITFPHMEAEMEAKRPAPVSFDKEIDWAKRDAELEEYIEHCAKWRVIQYDAMKVLEETAIALANQRTRHEFGNRDYFSGGGGFYPDYSVEKRGFVIEAWTLAPEIIAVLEDLQRLGSFKMHFETDKGELVHDDWWRDDEFELYSPDSFSYDRYVELLAKYDVPEDTKHDASENAEASA